MPTLREYIAALTALEQAHGGDIEVEKWLPSQGRHAAPLAVLAFKWEGPSGRMMAPPTPRFWHPTDPADQAGDPIIRV